VRGSLFLGLLCVVLGASAFSCSSDEKKSASTGGAAGKGGGSGGSAGSTGRCHPAAPPQCCSEELPVMFVRKNDQLVAPDWSCITGAGMGGAGGMGPPDGGAGVAGATDGGAGTDGGPPPNHNKFLVEDFISNSGVADIGVELFEGDSIVNQTPFHTDVTKGITNHADDSSLNPGEFWFPHPASATLSYRVKELPGVAKEFVGFGDQVPPPPGRVTGSTLSPASYEQLSTFAVPLVGWEPPPDLAIVVGPIRDCAGDDVGGAQIKYFDEETGQEMPAGVGERDIRYIYFDSQYPNPKCGYTDYRQSLWVIANAPANAAGPNKGHKYRVEYWGRLNESQTSEVKFAEKSLEIFQNTVNVHQIRPNVQQ
jgi:hypothetical protein